MKKVFMAVAMIVLALLYNVFPNCGDLSSMMFVAIICLAAFFMAME